MKGPLALLLVAALGATPCSARSATAQRTFPLVSADTVRKYFAIPEAPAFSLLDAQPSAAPFMRHEYLLALQESDSATEASGWAAQFLVIHEGAQLVAACPLYIKAHSYGEYVFDWAWADAYQRHGLRYYPKLLCAVPFTPVPGPRLLARDASARIALLEGMKQFA